VFSIFSNRIPQTDLDRMGLGVAGELGSVSPKLYVMYFGPVHYIYGALRTTTVLSLCSLHVHRPSTKPKREIWHYLSRYTSLPFHSSIYHASHAPLGLRRESQCQKRADAAETTNKARIRRLRSRDLKVPPGDKRGERPSETRPLQILYAHLDKLNLLHLS
jgi:hypothetical protein